jgi:hypothetical protein
LVISHKFKYVFVELPRTGSTAISKELQEYYDGHRILKKHSRYSEFLAQASKEERNYFVFSGIRNPMDRTLSFYFKLKHDHKNRFSSMRSKKEYLKEIYFRRLYDLVQDPKVTFQDYFLKRFNLPYDDWSSLDHHRMNAILRFEDMSADFDAALRKIGIDPVRQLPKGNATKGREEAGFESHFEPVKEHAIKIFGPFMQQAGYSFPDSWQVKEVPSGATRKFLWLKLLRKPFWKLFY